MYLGVLVFECRDHYPASDHLLKAHSRLWFVLEVKRSFELYFAGSLCGGDLTAPSVLGAPGAL
jgi:hypothetical protein